MCLTGQFSCGGQVAEVDALGVDSTGTVGNGSTARQRLGAARCVG